MAGDKQDPTATKREKDKNHSSSWPALIGTMNENPVYSKRAQAVGVVTHVAGPMGAKCAIPSSEEPVMTPGGACVCEEMNVVGSFPQRQEKG